MRVPSDSLELSRNMSSTVSSLTSSEEELSNEMISWVTVGVDVFGISGSVLITIASWTALRNSGNCSVALRKYLAYLMNRWKSLRWRYQDSLLKLSIFMYEVFPVTNNTPVENAQAWHIYEQCQRGCVCQCSYVSKQNWSEQKKKNNNKHNNTIMTTPRLFRSPQSPSWCQEFRNNRGVVMPPHPKGGLPLATVAINTWRRHCGDQYWFCQSVVQTVGLGPHRCLCVTSTPWA